MLVVIVDFSFQPLKGRFVASKLNGFRDIRTLLLYIVFAFAFSNILLLLTVFRLVLANRDLFGYIWKRLKV